MEFSHTPVLLEEAIDSLNIKPSGTYVDGTIGGGGHAIEIAKLITQEGVLIGIDQDLEAINASKKRLEGYSNIIYINDNFKNIKNIINDSGFQKVDGILLDLGVSSHQLDEESRGFSYMKDAPLDMRMDRFNTLTAEIIVNEWSEFELSDIISRYGEERWAKRIALFICRERKKKRIETTYDIVEIIKMAIPAAARRTGPHPAKRTFQAIRIAVNDELRILENTIKDSISILNHKGRLSIISFHSLEDRIVKNTFNHIENPCTCPPKIPQCICGNKSLGKVLNRKPIVANENELCKNPRARSAKLRVIERLCSNPI